jgi:hypothetical protein
MAAEVVGVLPLASHTRPNGTTARVKRSISPKPDGHVSKGSKIQDVKATINSESVSNIAGKA